LWPAAATSADLRERPRALPAATRAPVLTRAVAGSGTGARPGQEHPPWGERRPPRYDRCRARDCDRYGCIAYREGREDGYQDGYDDGAREGYEDGLAACQRTHRKD